MVQLNSKGEVADFVNESQFEGGESAYECVAFSAALIRYAGQPGKGPTGTGEQVDQAADYWYGKEEGGYTSGNTNGMSLDAEYMMLRGLGMPFTPLSASVSSVKGALQQGYPVMLCGAETGMHDLDLGGAVPYSWQPSGNHCIVASGIASDGNLLVRDTASIAPTGVRPGPRRYDASKLQIVSATVIIVPWEVETVITISDVGTYFTQTDPQHWVCKQTGKVIAFAILDAYQHYGNVGLNGLTFLGLPRSNEIPIEHLGAKYQHVAGKGVVIQVFERGDLVYDPGHLVDSAPGMGGVYPAHIYDGVGADLLAAVEPKPTPPPTIQGVDPTHVKNFQTALELQAHDLVVKMQELESAIIVPVS